MTFEGEEIRLPCEDSMDVAALCSYGCWLVGTKGTWFLRGHISRLSSVVDENAVRGNVPARFLTSSSRSLVLFSCSLAPCSFDTWTVW